MFDRTMFDRTMFDRTMFNRTRFDRIRFSALQPLRNFGKLAQSFVQPQPGIPRDQRDANFLRTNRRHIELASRSPVQLHELGPWRNPVVAADREPLFFLSMNVERGPAPDPGTAAVGANDPARGDEFALHHHAIGMETRYHGAPKKSHTHSFSVLDQDAVEIGAPHPKAVSIGERGFDGQPGTDKTNSAETMRLHGGNAHAEPLQSGDAIGHKALAARLVDRRTATVRDRDLEPALSRRQCRRDPRRTSADHEDIRRLN